MDRESGLVSRRMVHSIMDFLNPEP